MHRNDRYWDRPERRFSKYAEWGAYHWTQWADKDSEYHETIAEALRRTEHDELILDVGCGDGVFAVQAALRGSIVTAIDPDEDALHLAKEAALGKVPIRFIKGDVAAHKFDDKYDVAVLLDVFEHFEQPVAALANLRQCADSLLLVTPEYVSDKMMSNHHPYEYTEASLTNTLANAGWKVAFMERVPVTQRQQGETFDRHNFWVHAE